MTIMSEYSPDGLFYGENLYGRRAMFLGYRLSGNDGGVINEYMCAELLVDAEGKVSSFGGC